MQHQRVHHTGFTLMEILIVIVIIAILALIIIPRMIVPADMARKSSVQSNMQTINNALEVFRIDTGIYPYDLTDLTKASVSDLSANTRNNSNFVATNFSGPYLHIREGGIALLPRNPQVYNDVDVAAHWRYDHNGSLAPANE